MSPQALDQSNKEPLKEASSWSHKPSMSLKVLQLRSLQIHHIKHNGIEFQMVDECFPSQFHPPKRISETVHGKTHGTPNDLKTKLHNR